jgi:undecaprenyl-diphosphatase
MGFNATLFRMINGLAFQNAVLDKIMIFMSEYAPDIFMAVLAAVYIKGLVKKNKKMRVTAIDTFIIIVLNLFLGYIIGFIWYIPRPFVNNKVNLLVPHAADASFQATTP